LDRNKKLLALNRCVFYLYQVRGVPSEIQNLITGKRFNTDSLLLNPTGMYGSGTWTIQLSQIGAWIWAESYDALLWELFYPRSLTIQKI